MWGETVTSLVNFSMDEFLEHDQYNRIGSRKNLDQYWVHFQDLALIYSELHMSIDRDTFYKTESTALFYYFGGSFVNLPKAVSNLMAGHISDATIYARRTIEAVRDSVFLRECPQMTSLWRDPSELNSTKFRKEFRKWFSYSGSNGKKMVREELKLPESTWDLANSVGPHSNFALLAFQHQIVANADSINLRVNFHELEQSEKGHKLLLTRFFWHLRIHVAAIDWWIEKSGLNFEISRERVQHWQDRKGALEKTMFGLQDYLNPTP